MFNIAWNGLQGEGAVEMAQALKATRTIKEVDISSNRVSSEGFLTIMKALKENDTLATLKVIKKEIYTLTLGPTPRSLYLQSASCPFDFKQYLESKA